MQSRFIRITEVDESDWGYSDEKYAKLLAAYHMHAPVTVNEIEVDNGGGVSDYYNVQLADGTEFEAVSGVHLEGIQRFEPPAKPRTLTCQYIVELNVAEHREGQFLGHEMMALAIQGAIADLLKGSGFGGFNTTVGTVTYETDFYAGE